MNKALSLPNFYYLLHPYSTSLVTCSDTQGKANVLTISWVMPVSVKPPRIGMTISPKRYSYTLIRTAGEFVVNVAPYEIARQVLFCGRHSGLEVDKLAATGLTPGAALHVRPPIIEECIAHLECRMVQDFEAGDHRLVVADVLAAYAQPGILDDLGAYDVSRVRPLLYLAGNRFVSTGAEYLEPSLPL